MQHVRYSCYGTDFLYPLYNLRVSVKEHKVRVAMSVINLTFNLQLLNLSTSNGLLQFGFLIVCLRGEAQSMLVLNQKAMGYTGNLCAVLKLSLWCI